MPAVNRSVDLRNVERIYNYVQQVSYVGYFSCNRADPKRKSTHPTINFGVSLSGNYETKQIYLNEKLIECRYPFAFIELPGSTTQNARVCTNDQFYCSYPAGLLASFKEAGYVTSSGFWSIKTSEPLLDLLKNVQVLISAPYKRGNADLIDSYCMTIISELMVSRVTDQIKEDPDIENAIKGIYHILDTRYNQPISIETLARKHGMSVRTLRRHWRKYYTESMRLFITKRRISEAQRLMQQNAGSINQIARMVGYDDPLYFSKTFRKYTGITPSSFMKS